MVKVLGVDIGGTKVRMSVVDNAGNISLDEKLPTQFPLYPYLEEQVLRFLALDPEIEAIGIGTHGFVDPTQGKVIYATETLPGWTGTLVKEQLERATGKRVEVENDANAAALAEAKFGAAKGFGRTVCLTLGTGLGGGIIWDGKLLSGGKHGGAGEVGHMILHPNGVLCSCGREGCSEQYVSGTALVRRIKEAGLPITPQELFIQAKTDPAAQSVVDGFTKDLALVISSLQAAFDMDIVVIGGGVSESAELWWDRLIGHLEPLLLNPLDIKVAQFENEAGILGAALLVLEDIK
ncbi:ROK family protein [Planomicrobium sp. CPCC 101110]|uniref:ROK family protein n=1 Tax=Planomicrobium sp. CPCC 101110 TaxID=2599619 RepID=UPI0011B5CF33|nr:ROK family protein [Planomicrobium sp. CPCC 101110]TWT25088.1 ROK family protein [Planomicrobium sp. CPCC 101110]